MVNGESTAGRNVIAVVPTFRPDEVVIDRLRSLAGQVDSVIVVDDGSPPEFAARVDAIEAAGFELLRSTGNLGIASALNTGTRLALERGADYVLTLDQDSVLADGYVEACLSVFEISAGSKIGIACADRINGEPSLPDKYTPEGLGIVPEAIQSGFLISRECLETVGLFDARLFIDAVDTEYCLRMADHGYLIVLGPGTDIAHALGRQVPFRPFGRPSRDEHGEPRYYQYHGPVRRYFISRNNVDLYLRYWRSRRHWVVSSLRQQTTPAIKTIVGGPYRWRQFVAAISGFSHGLVRKRGPLSPRLRRALTPRR